MFTLTQIKRYCKVPISGIHLVKMYIPDEVSILPDPGLGVYSTQMPELTEAGTEYVIPFDRFSCSLSSLPDNGSVHGDIWTHTVKGNLRRSRAEIGLWLLQMRNRNFHILTEDWYGERLFFPFMRLAANLTVEQKLSGRNGFTFTFTRRWNHPGIYLPRNEAPPVDPGIWGDPDLDTGWSDGDDFWGFNP